MKISNSLLQAIAVGLSLSALTSCTKDIYEAEPGPEVNSENNIEHFQQTVKDPLGICPSGESNEHFNCPACGMG